MKIPEILVFISAMSRTFLSSLFFRATAFLVAAAAVSPSAAKSQPTVPAAKTMHKNTNALCPPNDILRAHSTKRSHPYKAKALLLTKNEINVDKTPPRKHKRPSIIIDQWCNGSTKVSGTFCWGSSPYWSTISTGAWRAFHPF